ncbi:small multidrug efflux protein [Microcella sp.]|uniref:small multidrug efflux protein n=1 Tax=Microcella sp. TaxID=1913979 RepID=UPI002563A988|nr:small multidrug efflux protein [Microcella sp.]MBX9472985.1 small multidrug efflux protein [Microcella sp.]
MNPVADLIVNFQDLVAQVPAFVQPFIIMLAATVPFIEGEVGALIGVAGGINPFIAAAAAMIGNFAAVVGVVAVTSRTREFALARRNGAGSSVLTEERPEPQKPQSKGRQRFARWVVRFGVPGASILGPLAIPTQFMSAMLVASGTPKGWVLLWQGVAIIFWTVLATVLAWLALVTLGV